MTDCTVNVWLFGNLAQLAAARPLTVSVPSGGTIDRVLEEVGRQVGPCLRARIMETPDRKMPFCRLFLDGAAVELDSSVPVDPQSHELELIVLTAAEGG